MTPQERKNLLAKQAADLKKKIHDQVAKNVAKGLDAARIFLTARVKETLSEPAPRVRLVDKQGNFYYVAGWLKGKEPQGLSMADYGGEFKGLQSKKKKGKSVIEQVTYVRSKAIKGAPPRKLSGRLRSSVNSRMLPPTFGKLPRTAVIGANAKGMPSKKWPTGFPYAAYHEIKMDGGGGGSGSAKHKYIEPTAWRYRKELTKIIGAQFMFFQT